MPVSRNRHNQHSLFLFLTDFMPGILASWSLKSKQDSWADPSITQYDAWLHSPFTPLSLLPSRCSGLMQNMLLISTWGTAAHSIILSWGSCCHHRHTKARHACLLGNQTVAHPRNLTWQPLLTSIVPLGLQLALAHHWKRIPLCFWRSHLDRLVLWPFLSVDPIQFILPKPLIALSPVFSHTYRWTKCSWETLPVSPRCLLFSGFVCFVIAKAEFSTYTGHSLLHRWPST